MEDNECQRIKDLLEMCKQEGIYNVGDLIRAEIKEEKNRQLQKLQYFAHDINCDEEIEKFVQWYSEMTETHKHDIEAEKVLLEAIENASSDPAMELSPKVKHLAELFCAFLIFRRDKFSYTIETILEPTVAPIAKKARAEVGRPGGKAPKKLKGMKSALLMYNKWASNPNTFKNQTKFIDAVIAAKHCDSINTARLWLNKFRTEQPSDELEKILPPPKKTTSSALMVMQ